MLVFSRNRKACQSWWKRGYGGNCRKILEGNLLEATKMRDESIPPRGITHTARDPVGSKQICKLLEWSSQIPGLHTQLSNWKHWCSPSNLSEFELFYIQEWLKISDSRCARLVETFHCSWDCSKSQFCEISTRGQWNTFPYIVTSFLHFVFCQIKMQ